MFGMGTAQNYVDETFKLFSKVLKQSLRRINKVAYIDGEIVFVHVEHFAEQGALVPNWLGVNDHPRSAYGIMVRDAVKLAVSINNTTTVTPINKQVKTVIQTPAVNSKTTTSNQITTHIV